MVRQLGHLCDREDNNGNTPLHLAAKSGNMQAIDNGLLSDEEEEDDEPMAEEGESGSVGSEVFFGQDCSSKVMCNNCMCSSV